MIEIDCSGGGQILRTALAMSTITNKPFRACNIRKSRPKPGLKAQHEAAIKALIELSDANASGAYEGSEILEFTPGRIVPKTLSINIGTAGSITLLMQSLLFPCALAEGKVRLKIRGGTDVRWSMSMDYFLNMVLPHYAKFKVNELKRGFYPKGGGLLDITIYPTAPQELNLVKKPKIDKIRGISSASADLRHADVAKRQAKSARKKLSSIDIPVKISEEYSITDSPGTVITLWVDGIGSDALGEPRKRSEAVGAEAAAELLYLLCSDAVVDNHLADNLIPLISYSGGRILTDTITDHIKSAAEVCSLFAKEVKIKGNLIYTDQS